MAATPGPRSVPTPSSDATRAVRRYVNAFQSCPANGDLALELSVKLEDKTASSLPAGGHLVNNFQGKRLGLIVNAQSPSE